jgi:uncharacterized protein (TIGR00255 family)
MLVREAVKSKISRGSVTININIEKDADKAEFNIDMEKAKSIYEKLNKLRADLKIKEVVKLEQILVFSELLKIESTVFDEKMYANIIRQLLNKGLLTLDQMRVNEGKNIEKDVLMRVKKIQQVVDKIRAKGLDRIPTEREKYRQKIAQLFEGDEIDEQRIYMEMVILSDKLDISEECVRLDSHIKYFFASLKEKDSVGRKINFLMQEMNREINTIGSKVNDAEISQLVVVVKEEIERIREQIQNVE